MGISVRSNVAVVPELDAAPLSFGTVVAHECVEVSAGIPIIISLSDYAIVVAM